jgi:hypothetical protein
LRFLAGVGLAGKLKTLVLPERNKDTKDCMAE